MRPFSWAAALQTLNAAAYLVLLVPFAKDGWHGLQISLTDEMAIPPTALTMFYFPAFVAGNIALALMHDRSLPWAVILPQSVYLVVAGIQLWGMIKLTRAAWRRIRG